MSQTHPTNEPKDVEAELRAALETIWWDAYYINNDGSTAEEIEQNREESVNKGLQLFLSAQARTHTDTIATIRANLPKDALAVRQDWQGLNWLDGCNDVINLVNALLTRLENGGSK
jgi:hypothetical protein